MISLNVLIFYRFYFLNVNIFITNEILNFVNEPSHNKAYENEISKKEENTPFSLVFFLAGIIVQYSFRRDRETFPFYTKSHYRPIPFSQILLYLLNAFNIYTVFLCFDYLIYIINNFFELHFFFKDKSTFVLRLIL